MDNAKTSQFGTEAIEKLVIFCTLKGVKTLKESLIFGMTIEKLSNRKHTD